jgi:hypothetical protein
MKMIMTMKEGDYESGNVKNQRKKAAGQKIAAGCLLM